MVFCGVRIAVCSSCFGAQVIRIYSGAAASCAVLPTSGIVLYPALQDPKRRNSLSERDDNKQVRQAPTDFGSPASSCSC